jgi:hypothetical protein
MAPQKKPETRSSFITFRLTLAERAALEKLAKRAGAGLRAFIRVKLGLEP